MLVKDYLDKNVLEKILEYAVFLYSSKSEVMFLPHEPYQDKVAPSVIEECLQPSSISYRRRKTVHRVPFEIYEIKNRIIEEFNLHEVKYTADIFFNHLKQKQKVAIHAHAKHKLGTDLRFNIMIKNSTKGGNPFVEFNGVLKEIEINNGDLWIFNGCKNHGTKEVEDDRYILSYGFIVEDSIANKIINY